MTAILSSWDHLSLRQKIAQLIIVRASGHLFDRQIAYPQWEAPQDTLRYWLEDVGVGGVILLGGSAPEVALRTQCLQAWANIPLLIAADVEEGVGQRFAGANWLPPPLALGALATQNQSSSWVEAEKFAQQYGAIVAQESMAIGLNWILAPVVDVNNNPLNPVINVRSFGETPEVVSALAQAFIQGCQGYPVLTTAKHFPGHGDTAIDSHLDLPQIPHDRSRLESLEWKPFRAAIEAQVSSIMTAHLALPALDADYPATLSSKILTDILRKAWGFDGIIVTDALIMQAITQRYGAVEAPILALEAGADVVLMPVDPTAAIDGILQAVQTGRLTIERIEASLQRLWQAKQQVNPSICQDPPSPLTALAALAEPHGETLSRSILSRSQQVQGTLAPATENNGTNLILLDNLLQTPFLAPHTPAVKQPATLGYRCQVLDQSSAKLPPQTLPQTLLQIFVRGNPFRGSGATHPWMQDWIAHLLTQGTLKALVVYGSPYAWAKLSAMLPPALPRAFTYGQMPIAQEMVLDSLFTTAVGQNGNKVETLKEFTT